MSANHQVISVDPLILSDSSDGVVVGQSDQKELVQLCSPKVDQTS